MSKFLKWAVCTPFILFGFIMLFSGICWLAFLIKVRNGSKFSFKSAVDGAINSIAQAFHDANEL